MTALRNAVVAVNPCRQLAIGTGGDNSPSVGVIARIPRVNLPIPVDRLGELPADVKQLVVYGGGNDLTCIIDIHFQIFQCQVIGVNICSSRNEIHLQILYQAITAETDSIIGHQLVDDIADQFTCRSRIAGLKRYAIRFHHEGDALRGH
ncbi:hypothetical protein D3C81_1520130 [compost metagenome]